MHSNLGRCLAVAWLNYLSNSKDLKHKLPEFLSMSYREGEETRERGSGMTDNC